MVDEQLYVLERLINSTNTAEGGALPPPLTGESRIPTVTDLKIARSAAFLGGTDFILTWLDPEQFRDSIANFNVYVKTEDVPTPTIYISPKLSPAKVQVRTQDPQRVSFTVQTQLKNGQVSDLAFSPTVSGTTQAALVQASDNPFNVPYRSVSTSTTLTSSDVIVYCDASGGSINITLPVWSSLPTGKCFFIKKVDTSANAVNLIGQTVDGTSPSITLPQMCLMIQAEPTTYRIL